MNRFGRESVDVGFVACKHHHNTQVRTRNADLQASVRPDNQTAGGVMLPAV